MARSLLDPRATRRLVLLLVALMLGLAALAAVLIARGWADEDFQERMRALREEQ